MMQNILIIDSINKHFDGIVAVDNVSLNIAQGSITGIYGENGAGKSTLFNLISGFEKPDDGKVLFKGKDITHKSVLFRARKGMGRLFQTPRVFADVSVYDNLMAAAKNSTGHHFYNYIIKRSVVKQEAKHDAQRANDILKQINLADKGHLKAYELSVGEKKLLSLGCLLMNEAKLMLLDEPFAGLNEKTIEQVKGTLLSIKEHGVTMLIIEHNMEAMGSICDFTIEMKEGSVNILKPSKEWFSNLSDKQNAKELILPILANHGELLEFAPEHLKDDYDVVLTAINHNGKSIKFASESLRTKKDFIMKAIEIQDSKNLTRFLNELHQVMLTDKDVAVLSIRKSGYYLEHFSDEIKNDFELVSSAVTKNGWAIQYASDSLKDNKDIVLLAVKEAGRALEFASDNLKNDFEVVCAAVKNDGKALEFASAELKDNYDLVYEAIQNNGFAIEFASENLKTNKLIVMSAVSLIGYRAFPYINEGLREDKEIARIAEMQELADRAYDNRAKIFQSRGF